MSPPLAARREDPVVHRINFRFSGRGRYLACLAAGRSESLVPEVWDLTGPVPRSRPLPTREKGTVGTVPVPTDDGGLLLCRFGPNGSRVTLVRDDGEEHELLSAEGGGLRLVAGTGRGTAAVAFEMNPDGPAVLWRLSGRAEPPEPITELPRLVTGGTWLDETGTSLAVTVVRPERRVVVVDVPSGAVRPLAGLGGDEHLLAAARRGGVLLTAAQRDGGHRLGVRHRGGRRPTIFPARLNAVEGTVAPLALDPGGRRLALSVTRGVRSHLLVHDLTTDTGTEIDLPAGIVHAPAHWNGRGLTLLHSGPDRPVSPVTVTGASPPRITAAHPAGGWAPAHARDLRGAEGSVEVVVYGEPATSAQVVVALHGGPEAAWQLGFEPLFQRLAAAGIAVVAPNQRGSTGYGAAHRDAIRGAWGGPDLADIAEIGRILAAERGPGRERPMLYGASYGAYLALLAAAARADLWARAVAVAPFLSAGALYEDGTESVRNLIDRLRGREETHEDELGPRDLLRLAGRMRLPLLLVHGERDTTIPAAHSRRLYDRLLRTGRTDPVTYLEIPGAGHDPMADGDGHLVTARVVEFLRAGPSHPA
ncbi:alpha/beta hydrolase family protein [Sphaerisporangium fuscum]|uniref:alpha/beta hydrolase family protein n=1 Tax=Sphaerisporangium fuscum TaxID=2835868 RepID=UPI001BDC04C9|nr:alpha/beta fold hydrolase [Sphaerisporangium fuscum]